MTQSDNIKDFRTLTEYLNLLSNQVAQMGGLAEQQLADAIEAIDRRDVELAEATIGKDRQIDHLERLIETSAVRTLTLNSPQASDLRDVVAALKISTDLERIGDLGKNIAKRALVLSGQPPLSVSKSLTRMGRQALVQVKDVLDAYAARDAEASVLVWQRDQELDELYNSLFRELLTYMMEDQRIIGLAAHMMFVAKNLERIGDHATNIAETTYYLVNGRHIDDVRPKGDTTSLTAIEFDELNKNE